jgi:hypothetical protein
VNGGEATKMKTELLSLAMRSPDAIDDLMTIIRTDDEQMTSPRAGLENALACRRLEERLSGREFDPTALDPKAAMDLAAGGRDSDVFLDLHYNAKRYVDFLMRVDQYPPELRAKADAEFPPLGHDPLWTIPSGFRQERGVLSWLHSATSPNVEARLRSGTFSPTVIIIERPSATDFCYPWQQAISAHAALFAAERRFFKISAGYVSIGKTKAFEVCYRDASLEIVKVPILLQRGLERMFEFHSPSLREDKHVFDGFLRALR